MKANSWSRVVGPFLTALAVIGLLLLSAWLLALATVVVAIGIAISARRTSVDIQSTGLRCRRTIGSFDLRWDEVAGAVVTRAGYSACQLVVVDMRGRYRQTGLWRWRLPGHVSEELQEAARAINTQVTALPGLAELDEPELRTTLAEFSRETLLRAAGLDELGAERRSDKMVGLWFLVLIGSAALGGGLGAALGAMWVGYTVMAVSVGGFLLWASRQPRLPPQRRALRLSWPRTKPSAPTDHT